MIYVIQTALELGFMYALVAMALFLSYRILDIADLTTDSGFVLGAAVSVTVAAAGQQWLPEAVPVLSPHFCRPDWEFRRFSQES